jgi:hypothetical protein
MTPAVAISNYAWKEGKRESGEHWSERFSPMQLLRQMVSARKEGHLGHCVATIGVMHIGFNEFADRETICSFAGRHRSVQIHAPLSMSGLWHGGHEWTIYNRAESSTRSSSCCCPLWA